MKDIETVEVTFASPDDEQKVVITGAFNKAESTMQLNLAFDPPIGNESKGGLHCDLAFRFMDYLHGKELG